MAIGVRRDRTGVMPGTESYPALAATGIVKGDVCKLASGKLVQAATGEVHDEAMTYLAVADYVADVTAPSATTIEQLVMPMMDGELTFVGAAVSAGTGDASALVPGDLVDLNSTGDGLVSDNDPVATDFIVIKVLESDSSAKTATLEVRIAG